MSASWYLCGKMKLRDGQKTAVQLPLSGNAESVCTWTMLAASSRSDVVRNLEAGILLEMNKIQGQEVIFYFFVTAMRRIEVRKHLHRTCLQTFGEVSQGRRRYFDGMLGCVDILKVLQRSDSSETDRKFRIPTGHEIVSARKISRYFKAWRTKKVQICA